MYKTIISEEGIFNYNVSINIIYVKNSIRTRVLNNPRSLWNSKFDTPLLLPQKADLVLPPSWKRWPNWVSVLTCEKLAAFREIAPGGREAAKKSAQGRFRILPGDLVALRTRGRGKGGLPVA
jgi:hypothetical protein